MKLIVGLGNPGAEYAGHRHNVGFMALERIAERSGGVSWRSKFQGQSADIVIDGVKCVLLKPQTFMNESGRSVQEAARFYKIEPSDVLVLHDEVDLEPAKVRLKSGGGVAGHNGLKSVAAHIGSNFRRVRIGVGHPGQKDRVPGFVLRNFSKADLAWLEPLLDDIADAAALLVTGDDANFMNQVARQRAGRSTPTKKRPAETKQKPAPPKSTSLDMADRTGESYKGALAHLLRRLLGAGKR